MITSKLLWLKGACLAFVLAMAAISESGNTTDSEGPGSPQSPE